MAEMLRSISSRELTEWKAYEAKNGPLGPARLDVLMAMTNMQIAAQNWPKGKKPPELKDFLPDWDGSLRGMVVYDGDD